MTMATLILGVLTVVCLTASLLHVRSARLRWRLVQLIQTTHSNEGDAFSLAYRAFRKEVQTAFIFSLVTVVAALMTWLDNLDLSVILGVLIVPAVVSILESRSSLGEVRMARNRFDIETRYKDTLEQKDLAPKAWAARLAPDQTPDFSGFEIGRVYEAGSGLMSGDFFDVYRLSKTRVAAVIGDVSGHNIESSLTAFQAKYLLRVFLKQFRDPAQALEEINEQMSSGERSEEFISACVVIFDTEAGTLRYASAGHPAIILFHGEGNRPLRSTGALLMLDTENSYHSKEFPMESGDLLVMYTDGLSEARPVNGLQQFGQQRIIRAVERDLSATPDVICKSLLDVAKDFARGSINDDLAIMAIRRD